MNPSSWSRRIALLIVAAIVALEIGHLWLGRSTGTSSTGTLAVEAIP